MNNIENIMDEAKVNYKVKPEIESIDSPHMKEVIDQYCEADAEKKVAEKKMKELRSEIDGSLEKFSGTHIFEGNNHKIQVVEKFSYELNQSECDNCEEFKNAVSRGRLEGFSQKITLDIVPNELNEVVRALENAGLHHVVEEISQKYVFNGKAEDVRKLDESVDKFNLMSLFDAKRTVQISAKK